MLAPVWYPSANVILVTDSFKCLYSACLVYGLLYIEDYFACLYYRNHTH